MMRSEEEKERVKSWRRMKKRKGRRKEREVRGEEED